MRPAPAPTPTYAPTGNSGDNDISSIKALLKVLHCGDLLRVIAPLFIIVNSKGTNFRNITSPELTGTVGEQKRSLLRTLALLSPAHPRRWGGGGQWLQMTGA